jgi:probable HAF family extracellular repeat protein
MHDLNAPGLGGNYSIANALNAAGQVAGVANTAGNAASHAFLYDGTMHDLNAPGLGGDSSYAAALNDAGHVVGFATTPGNASHAFLYSHDTMLDLNELLPVGSGWVLYQAGWINKNGHILGYGSLNGANKLFLLTPNLPVAVANTTVSGPFSEWDPVILDGTGSSAPGCTRPGAPMTCPTYQWSQVSGKAVTLSSPTEAQPSFTTPGILPMWQDTLTFKLVVNDSVTTAETVVDVTVTHVNQKPVADAGLAQTVNESSPVILSGAASYDPEAAPLTYLWTNQSTDLLCAGSAITLSGADTATTSFTSPAVGSSGAICIFELTVFDDKGEPSVPVRVNVNIVNVNQAPVANAGLDITANQGDAVMLNGSGSSDPDHDPLIYNWQQISGPPVNLSNTTAAQLSFTAPVVAAGGATLVFELKVSDSQIISAGDQVSVKVLHPADPPACDRGKVNSDDFRRPDHSMNEIEIKEVGEDKEARVTGVSEKDHEDVYVKILNITTDEPTSNIDKFDSRPDAVILAHQQRDTLLLRAERAEGGNGRVYTVTYSATDKKGLSCQGIVKVCVPGNTKQKTCTDDGQKYDAKVK